MNLSINSLSLLSVYSFSPVLTHYSINFANSYLKNYFPIIFFNPYNLNLEKSKFSKGFGPLLYDYPLKIYSNVVIKEYYDITHTKNNYSLISPPSNSSLVIIRDCHFIDIYNTEGYYISSDNYRTFYITSCVFNRIQTNRSLIYISTRATKVTHICFNNVSEIIGGSDLTFLFFNIINEQTFCEFVYSSVSLCTSSRSNGELFWLSSSTSGDASYRFRCINTSHSKSYYILLCYGVKCTTIQMNTFSFLQSMYCFRFYKVVLNNIYCEMTNFYYVNCSKYLIDMYESYTTRVTYDRCIFIQYRSVLGFVIDGYAIVTNCIFDKGTTLGLDVTTSNVHIISNPVSFNLAHFSTDNVCIGEPNENAFGCNNGTCPSSMGCPLNAFSFQESDAIYTEKLYPGYNTVRTITSNFFY